LRDHVTYSIGPLTWTTFQKARNLQECLEQSILRGKDHGEDGQLAGFHAREAHLEDNVSVLKCLKQAAQQLTGSLSVLLRLTECALQNA